MIRQGDVLLVKTDSIPADCVEIEPEGGRLILMRGEVTGHAHAIADWADAERLADGAIGLAQRRARLLRAPNGTRYLEVFKPVSLTHEEHTLQEILPGIYKMPVQVEYTTEHRVQQVAD